MRRMKEKDQAGTRGRCPADALGRPGQSVQL
jgi:hypothetical protein